MEVQRELDPAWGKATSVCMLPGGLSMCAVLTANCFPVVLGQPNTASFGEEAYQISNPETWLSGCNIIAGPALSSMELAWQPRLSSMIGADPKHLHH